MDIRFTLERLLLRGLHYRLIFAAAIILLVSISAGLLLVLLDHIQPDVVHIMADGRIVKTGGPEVALEVETNGYADILAEVA